MEAHPGQAITTPDPCCHPMLAWPQTSPTQEAAGLCMAVGQGHGLLCRSPHSPQTPLQSTGTTLHTVRAVLGPQPQPGAAPQGVHSSVGVWACRHWYHPCPRVSMHRPGRCRHLLGPLGTARRGHWVLSTPCPWCSLPFQDQPYPRDLPQARSWVLRAVPGKAPGHPDRHWTALCLPKAGLSPVWWEARTKLLLETAGTGPCSWWEAFLQGTGLLRVHWGHQGRGCPGTHRAHPAREASPAVTLAAVTAQGRRAHGPTPAPGQTLNKQTRGAFPPDKHVKGDRLVPSSCQFTRSSVWGG